MIIKEECPSCSGTGLYKGFAEKGQLAVVCRLCDGKAYRIYQYKPFTERKRRDDVLHVISSNPGYCLDEKHATEDMMIGVDEFYASDDPFTIDQKLQRNFRCPAQAAQNILDISASIVGKHLPCPGLGQTIGNCSSYGKKDECWAKVDAENILGTKCS